MHPPDLLSMIQALLLAEDLAEAEIVTADSEQPQRLLVPLNLDTETPLLLQLLVTEPVENTHPENNTPSAAILYFFAEIPLTESAAVRAEVPPLLALLNPLLPLGSLEISSRHNLYYRYGLLHEMVWPDPRSAIEIIATLKETLPPLTHYLQQVLQATPPLPSGRLEDLQQEFRQLLSQRTSPWPILPVHPLKPKVSPLLRFSLAYLGMAILALTLGTLATAWSYPLLGLSIGLMLLLPGFATVWFYQQKARQQLQQQKLQQKFKFYLHILETERLRVLSHQNQIERQRDSLDYALMHQRQTLPDTPQQLLRLHQRLKQLISCQEQLMQMLTGLKKRLRDLELSRENLLQEIHNLSQPLSEAFLPKSPELEDTSQPQELISLLLLKLASLLNYLDFESQTWPASAELPTYLQVSMTHSLILISGRTDWKQPQSSTVPQTWMLQFEAPLMLSVPEAQLRPVQELLIHFNRFLPVGSASFDRRRKQVVLRHRFVRLQGDMSNFLVIEILEMLDFFARKLKDKLQYFLEKSPPLEDILQQLESEFITLLH